MVRDRKPLPAARSLIACALAAALGMVAGCGGGHSGPTAPAGPAAVAGSWSGTTTTTVTSGSDCFSRQPQTAAAAATIVQNGTAISGTLGNCSFHGTVSDTAISWTQDPVAQQSDRICGVAYPVLCAPTPGGGIIFAFVVGPSIDVAGSVSGNQIAASGTATSHIVDSAGHQISTIQASVKLALLRK